MKHTLIFTLILIFIAAFFPLVSLMMVTTEKTAETSITASEKTKETENETTSEKQTEESTVSVFSEKSGKTEDMSIRDYLFGTVCAEMPASFHEEALKAQAVASYTYLKWIRKNADNPEQYKADITDNPSKHQSFISDDELKEKWGTSYDIYREKINSIIDSVVNEYMEYEGEPAMTVYHAVSPGRTQSSKEVWSNELPYLSGVPAPGDSLSPYYSSQVTVSEEEFIKKLGVSSADTKSLQSNTEKNEDGWVISITSDGKKKDKAELRNIFSLNSPYFDITKKDKDIIFTVYGKGHGIGMSQYSADYMARQGSTYKEILTHFYKGAELVKE